MTRALLNRGLWPLLGVLVACSVPVPEQAVWDKQAELQAADAAVDAGTDAIGADAAAEVLADVVDVADSADAPDAADAPDLEDSADVAGLADVLDDVSDVPDVAEVSDVPDTAVDTAVDAADITPDIAPDVSDPCLALNCDDTNVCTTDSCASGACVHLPNTATCSDGNDCTIGDTCSAGVCKGVGPVCGNGTCDCGENTAACAADCTSSAPAGMVLIPAGTFWMGCNATKDKNCNAYEKPQHSVTLSAYYMDLTETTVAQYKACVDAGVCTVPSTQSPAPYATYPGFPNNPVSSVSWTQSQVYCQWRGAAFDLPTEAQWEMAARGSCEKNGSTAANPTCAAAMRTYPWGETTATCSYAVMSDGNNGCGTSATWAVGSIPAGDSPYGLHDMAGNVREWNRDWAGAYSTGAVTDPVGPGSASTRIYRGGAFGSGAALLRAGTRNSNAPSYVNYDIGLRCMRPLEPCANVSCPAIACASNTCDPGTGQCVATKLTDGAACEDGSACTSNDQCVSGACFSGGATNCDDGNACTNDACAPVTGCSHVGSDSNTCSDGSLCTADSCVAGVCQGVAVDADKDGYGPGAACGGDCSDGNAAIHPGAVEVCNGVDDNCDGVTDEGCASTPAGMVLIPAGTFWMGCNATKDTGCAKNEKPQHQVTLSAYYMDVTETTVAQYKACVDAGVCTVPSVVQPTQYATYPGLTTNPVNNVSWTQSQAYCKWRGAAFDLPTEAQWEMAARGSCEKNGSTAGDAGCAAAMRTYPWGETVPTASYAVFSDSVTAAVGSKTAGDSPYGLHDMAGNVWEWNRDWYSATYYSSSPATDPFDSASATNRVGRGGSFSNAAAGLRAGYRSGSSPSVGYGFIGLRCMRSSP